MSAFFPGAVNNRGVLLVDRQLLVLPLHEPNWLRFEVRACGQLLLVALALPFWFGGQSNLDQAANCASGEKPTDQQVGLIQDKGIIRIKSQRDENVEEIYPILQCNSVASSRASVGGLLFRSTSHSNLIDDFEPMFNW
jgi:hypothetical protein